jgi:deoxyribonuclease-4
MGAHVSIAGGVATAPGRGERIGADVVQIFSKHGQRWEGKAIEPDDAQAFRAESARTGVRTVAVHCAYLINLASAKENVRTRSLYALEDEASRAASLGIPWLVMHPGSPGDDPEETGIERIVAGLKAFGRFPAGVSLLLENTAGQGASLGKSMEQLRRILDGAGNPPDVAVCLDSAHLFEAGYDLPDPAGWAAFREELARTGILPLVRMWHLNDSKSGLSSRVDRHEHIGRGRIGLEGFRNIVNDPVFRGLPLVLETPKDGADEYEMDLVDLAALRALVAPSPR